MTAEEYLVNKIQLLEKEKEALINRIQDIERFHKSELLDISYQSWKKNNSYYFEGLKEEMPKKEYKLIKCNEYYTSSLVDLIDNFGYEMVEQWLTQDIMAELDKEAKEATKEATKEAEEDE